MSNVMMIGGTSVLRNPGLDPLDDKQLKAFAPTIFAKSGIEGVSDKYGFVSSIEIVRAMRDSGFEPVEVRQSKRRDEGLMPWTKHMMKFRKTGLVKKITVGDVVPQVVMLNSHDRSSGFHLYGGLFRLVCSNGLLVSDGADVQPIKVSHTLRMVQDVVDKSRVLLRDIDGVFKLRENMLGTELSAQAARKFAERALEFRPPRAGKLAPETVLEPRREEDKAMDLWHVFNRVQENMLRGGNVTTVTHEDGSARQVQTRGIGRIERDVQVNSALWSLAVQTIAKAASSSRAAAKKTGRSKKAEVVDIDAELSK